MPDSNRVSATLSAEQLAIIMKALADLRQAMPFTVTLSADERRELPKLGPKSLGFDERCAAHMASHPELVPSFIDPAEIDKDRALREPLVGIVRNLMNVAASAEDTLLLVSHEIYSADLAFYQNVRQAAKRGLPDAETIFNDLTVRFPGRAGAAASADTKAVAVAHA